MSIILTDNKRGIHLWGVCGRRTVISENENQGVAHELLRPRPAPSRPEALCDGYPAADSEGLRGDFYSGSGLAPLVFVYIHGVKNF